MPSIRAVTRFGYASLNITPVKPVKKSIRLGS
ncbi:hypothetical protein BH11MYX1_BH11MYX1_56870 [soil metagenome]